MQQMQAEIEKAKAEVQAELEKAKAEVEAAKKEAELAKAKGAFAEHVAKKHMAEADRKLADARAHQVAEAAAAAAKQSAAASGGRQQPSLVLDITVPGRPDTYVAQ
jgi:hypothetical protein